MLAQSSFFVYKWLNKLYIFKYKFYPHAWTDLNCFFWYTVTELLVKNGVESNTTWINKWHWTYAFKFQVFGQTGQAHLRESGPSAYLKTETFSSGRLNDFTAHRMSFGCNHIPSAEHCCMYQTFILSFHSLRLTLWTPKLTVRFERQEILHLTDSVRRKKSERSSGTFWLKC